MTLIVNQTIKNEGKGQFSFINYQTIDKYKKFTGNSNGMFAIESHDMNKGGLLQWDKFYRLKHLSTNSYLAVE